ncbi:MAG: hypothetical protein ACLTTO_08835 [Lachnospiraceae bacterium]
MQRDAILELQAKGKREISATWKEIEEEIRDRDQRDMSREIDSFTTGRGCRLPGRSPDLLIDEVVERH